MPVQNNLIIRGLPILINIFVFANFPSQGTPTNKPNVIFILADDLGYGDLGCYGQSKIQTPNIDQLASDGMLFTQAYSGSSVCAPSRCSLMTGFHNGHNRIRDNLPHDIYLRPDDFTLAELFKSAGYRTGGVGKWGLGIPGTWGLPNQQGFDYWYGHYNQDQAHFYYPDFLWENDKLKLLQEMEIKNDVGVMTGNRGGENKFYSHDLFTQKATDFITNNKDHPFFLFIAYTVPHYSDYPKDTPEHFIVPTDEPYSGKNWPQVAKNYAAMISRMDRDIGKLTELIKSLQIDENTLIVFTSDNGPYKGNPTPIEFFNSNGKLRGGKRDLYEGGIRIPFIAKWKNVIPANTKNDKIIAFYDMLPTFAELLNYPDKIKSDGISVLTDLKGEQGKNHKYLYWDYGHVRNTYKQALRYNQYKAVRIINEEKSTIELYNLENDPGETNDIASKNPGVVNNIKKMLNEAYEYTNDYPRKIKQ
jgi:arylsulfatase A-like enzyme